MAPCLMVSDDALQNMRELPPLNVTITIFVKVLNVRAVFVMPGLGLGGRPLLQKYETPWLALVFVQVITDIAVLVARRLDKHGQIAAQLVLLACLGL